ncbi:hypothetical protein ACFOWE_00050 [Planomonospora corallina]|uniref:Methyltransferase n=1 Tax=Planomonospora corallina TaxID=1806052 RepID=A0ABV8HXM2_9ACTN
MTEPDLLAAYDSVAADYAGIMPGRLPATFAEFGRVLAPGGHLLLGFPACDGSA